MKIVWEQHGNQRTLKDFNSFFVVLHKSGGLDSPDMAKMWLETPFKAELYVEGNSETELIAAFADILKKLNFDSNIELHIERAY